MLDAPIKIRLTKYVAHTAKEVTLSGGRFAIIRKDDGTVVKDDFRKYCNN